MMEGDDEAILRYEKAKKKLKHFQQDTPGQKAIERKTFSREIISTTWSDEALNRLAEDLFADEKPPKLTIIKGGLYGT